MACRSCEINTELVGTSGQHSIVDAGIFCPECQSVNSSIYHPEGDDLYGDSYECNGCNNYIIYTNGNGTIYKDEIYLDKAYAFIRNVEDNSSTFLIGSKVAFTFANNLVGYSNAKALFKKLKTLLVLS